MNDSTVATAIEARHQAWAATLPKDPGDLWDVLHSFDRDSQQLLFAHCVALSVNAVAEPYNRRPRALAHADRLAAAVDLDMAAAGWTPPVETYLGRVTKARIMEAVREAKGERAAESIAHLRKGEMAEAAQALLTGSGWLPEPLRTPSCDRSVPDDAPLMEPPETVIGGDQEAAPGDLESSVELDCHLPHAIAAE